MPTAAEKRLGWRVPLASEKRASTPTVKRLDSRATRAFEKQCVDTHREAVGLANSPRVWEAVRRHSRRSGCTGEFPERLSSSASALAEKRLDWRVPRASETRCVDTHGEAVGLASSPGV